jgi:hypothetical protein
VNELQIPLNLPQAQFLAMPQKFKAFVAGFGSGKTWVGCSSLGKHFLEFPRVNAGYFAPTYAQIRDIFYPTIDEALFPWGFSVKIKTSDKEVDLYQGRKYYGTIICRSMEKPETIIGFKIGKALVDEIDVLKMEKARTAWRKIIARLRFLKEGLQNGIDVTTTPEGFKFVHSQFVEQVRINPQLSAMYGLIQASTYDNEANLPDDYIPSLLASYPAQLIDAYINGQFVNLKTGSVYVAYNRQANACDDVVQPQDTLFIGMDFNVGKMAAITHVKRSNLPCAVDEIVNAYDTPDMIRRIKERYWAYENGDFVQNRAIRIYPDASGDNRKSVTASETDLALLRQAGFQVICNRSNPPVKDRINSMNGMFCNAKGERRYLVNHNACPTYTASLEQQAWSDSGEPDKTTGHDHTNDAGGYFINFDYPIMKRSATQGSASMR